MDGMVSHDVCLGLATGELGFSNVLEGPNESDADREAVKGYTMTSARLRAMNAPARRDDAKLATKPTPEDIAWGREIVRSSRKLLPAARALAFAIVEHDPDGETQITTMGPRALDPALRAMTEDAIAHRSFEGVRIVDRTRLVNRTDAAVVAHAEPSRVVALYAAFDRSFRGARPTLARVALHIEASHRLRGRAHRVESVLDGLGNVIAREAPSRLGDVWPGLITGRLSLVERGSAQNRRYLVIENGPVAQRHRALAASELAVLSHAARGLSTKAISYTLGLAAPTVSQRLTTAASKLGVTSRIGLLRLAATLTHAPPPPSSTTKLTRVEREVLELLRQGLTNEAIAATRSRSVRTIANQVASILRKTKSETRRALAVFLH